MDEKWLIWSGVAGAIMAGLTLVAVLILASRVLESVTMAVEAESRTSAGIAAAARAAADLHPPEEEPIE